MGFWVFFSDDKVEYYDSDACELYLSPSRTVAIVANSKTILDFLIMNRDAAMSRDQIIARIDGIEECRSSNNKHADRGPVDQAISELRRKLDKYANCVKTVRGVGYKYVGPPKVEKGFSTSPPNASYSLSSNIGDNASNQEKNPQKTGFPSPRPSPRKDDVHSSNDNVIKLSSVLIHKGGQDHPRIDAELELEIRSIIELLEQGLSEDFEEICEQAWEELTLMQKAMKIFRAYENLTDRSRNLTPTDPNTRL